VRVNPLETDGMDDLATVMRGAPDIVGLPKVSDPAQVVLLAEAVSRCEREYGLAEGSTVLWPNIELARGVIQTAAIGRASPRVKACLMASEDLAADLGAERGQDGIELAYARQRFLMECVAAGVMAVDCPYTWRGDPEGLERDTLWARRLGYKAKSLVAPEHAAVINRVLTPSDAEVERAQQVVTAFEEARARGLSRVEVAGSMIEMPIFHNARRLLARAKELGEAARDR
jgi:citrate lyase subunit beta/citryl-CoA lyase